MPIEVSISGAISNPATAILKVKTSDSEVGNHTAEPWFFKREDFAPNHPFKEGIALSVEKTGKFFWKLFQVTEEGRENIQEKGPTPVPSTPKRHLDFQVTPNGPNPPNTIENLFPSVNFSKPPPPIPAPPPLPNFTGNLQRPADGPEAFGRQANHPQATPNFAASFAQSTPYGGPMEVSTLSETLREVGTSIGGSIGQQFADNLTSNSVVQGIKPFSGKKHEFKEWAHQINLARDQFGEERALRVLRAKLGTTPTDYLATRTGLYTVADILTALAKEYDPQADPMIATKQWRNLKQGDNETITQLHSRVYSYCRLLRIPLDTQNITNLQIYIDSLQDKHLQMKLYRDFRHDKTTLEKLMEVSIKGYQAQMAVDLNSQGTSRHQESRGIFSVTSNDNDSDQGSECLDEHSSTSAAEIEQVCHAFSPTGKFCVIHHSRSHMSRDCRRRNDTFCKPCGQKVQRGTLIEHLKNCRAPQCTKCGSRTHKSADCRKDMAKLTRPYDRTNKAFDKPKRFDRSHSGSRNSYPQKRFSDSKPGDFKHKRGRMNVVGEQTDEGAQVNVVAAQSDADDSAGWTDSENEEA